MKNVKHLSILAIGAALTLTACNKGSDTPTTPPTTGPYASINVAYAEVAPKYKSVLLNATTGGSFYGNSGTRYVFPANAFQTAAGVLVAGNINIDVLECTTESDMIFGKMLTMSNGEPLISAGEASVKATQSGNPIYIRPGISYQIKMPTNNGSATASMDFFSGKPSSTIAGTTVNWNLRNTDSIGAGRVVYNGDTISMVPDSVGFFNLDKYPSNSFAIVDVKIGGLGATLKPDQLYAYYILDGTLSAASIYSAKTAFTDNTYKGTKILKLKAHYIVCAVNGGEFYGGILQNTTAIDGNAYTISISKTTPTAFKKAIDALK